MASNSHSEFPELMTGVQARQFIGLTTTVWLEFLETDRLPKPVKVGTRFMWRKCDLSKWVRELKPAGMLG